ncbi:Immunity protein 40 [Paraburkholderia phenazinium]|uniref:Immunity protein 40 n=1 Tax=Paraburkholderia phenazinium TaxID=60549 RepID=A0A1N6LH85_9BURK|nr:Immunity protein 40 [Paraburkholderia phenazinium]
MPMTISRILELYARSGRSLEDMGLKEAALDLSEAGQALDLFAGQKWLLLGGDVYRATSDGRSLEPTYDNWFYEGNNVDEGISAARDFLHSLRDRSLFVVFVVTGRTLPP